MKFQISRASEGAVSKRPPLPGAIRGPASAAWPGEYQWFVEVKTLDELLGILNASGGALGLFAPEDEAHPAIEIFDDDEDE